MKAIKLTLTAGIVAVAIIAAIDVSAQSTMNHGAGHEHMNHDAMPGQGSGAADVDAKINSVDVDGGMLNVTHGPVEALGWPSMTMDLPVTRRVDLSTVKPGDDVTLSLKQGRDKQFRVIGISPK
ncbi:MAG: hypothetical protein CBB68_04150 [Rhodospirillaceae bacterium TMED8]|nr:hypothetical protein [Magnetovibrio sp.]OUT51531.1 MAG: hypothetical protein CBB68_04150 [Rhodospirillaceae bacterium TMED8]